MNHKVCSTCGYPPPQGVVDEISEEDLLDFPDAMDPLIAVEIYANAVVVTRPVAVVTALLAAAGVMALLGTLSRILGF